MECKLYERADFWIVVSEEDAQLYGVMQNMIVCPTNYCSGQGVVNKKKIYGLTYLYKQYEYIWVIDDDTLFTHDFDLYDVCQNYYRNKILLGNKALETRTYNIILSNCLDYYKADDIELYNKECRGLYLWFNQPCIYKCDLIHSFFETTSLPKRFGELNWFTFDYYIYMIYLVVKEKWTVVDARATAIYGICEVFGDGQCVIEDNDFLKTHITQCTSYLAQQMGIEPVYLIHMDKK